MLSTIIDIVFAFLNVCNIYVSFIRQTIKSLIKLSFNKSLSLATYLCFKSMRLSLDVFIDITAFVLTPSRKAKVLPITDRLLLQSTQELTEQIKLGKLKSQTLVKAYIDRIKSVQPVINAVVDQRYTEALLEAIEIDKRVLHELYGNDPLIPGVSIHDQPLLGIPLSVKNSIGVEGMAFDAGHEPRKGEKSKTDSKVIQSLRKAGAIPLVMTNVPELTSWWDSSNKIYGQTNNPYDLSRIPGGSSGGEAALIASAGSLIGVGSDTGGSIRVPACFCGIFGHRTTPGVVPTDNQFPAVDAEKNTILSVGPMTRYAKDILPMLKVMSNSSHKLKLNEDVDLSKVKIYYMEDNWNPLETRVSSEIKHAIRRVVKHFQQKYGNYTKKIYFDKLSDGLLIWIYSLKRKSNVSPFDDKKMTDENYDKFQMILDLIKYFFNLSVNTLSTLVMKSLFVFTPSISSDFGQNYVHLGRELKLELKQLLAKDGILIYPTYPEPPPKHMSTIVKLPNISYTTAISTLGVPVTNCPLGLTKSGYPIGLQIVGSPFNDRLTIAVANELEKAFGGWVSPTNIVC